MTTLYVDEFNTGTGVVHLNDTTNAIVIGGTTTANADIILNADGSVVINEQGSAVDVRVEGDTDINLLFVDGSADAVGIGVAAPAGKLEVNNTVAAQTTLVVDQDGATGIGIDIQMAGTGDAVQITGTTGLALDITKTASGQWFSMNDGTDTFGVYNSAGSPEGSITANTGSLCIDTTNGEAYVKQDDGDNTNWVKLTYKRYDTEKAANFTALNGYIAPVNCSGGAITVSPPADAVGNTFSIIDSRASAQTNNITIDFSGSLFYASAGSDIINENGAYITYEYVDATIGWVRSK